LFIDAVHPEHNTLAAYGWIKHGQKRELKTNSGRQRLNLHGTLNAETYEFRGHSNKRAIALLFIQIDGLTRDLDSE